MRTVICCLFLLFSSVSLDAKEILFTTNKSGTHFFLYSLQYLTAKPFINIGGNGLANFDTQLQISPEKEPIFHTHIPPDVIQNLSKKDKLIFLTRSPIELFLRSFGYTQTKFLLEIIAKGLSLDPSIILTDPTSGDPIPIQHGISRIKQVVDSFKVFHGAKNRYKILIFYEDLITQPEKVMEMVLLFLDEDGFRLQEYTENLDLIRYNAHAAYTAQWDRDPSTIARSDGLDPLYYQKQCSETEVQELKQLLKLVFPKKYDQYLMRFW